MLSSYHERLRGAEARDRFDVDVEGESPVARRSGMKRLWSALKHGVARMAGKPSR